MTVVRNLFDDRAVPPRGERFEEIARLGGVRIERIVSSAEPEPIEYDQGDDEWVVVLRGEAELEVEGSVVTLGPGDYLWLPAHTRHRVRSTAHGTLWLAVHALAE